MILRFLAIALLVACTPEPIRRAPPSSAQLSNEMGGDPTPPPAPSPAPTDSGDGPEISRSLGVARGVVVLWPRIARGGGDPTTTELAGKVQRKLLAIAQKAVPGAPVDVRPEPERVCPRPNGCTAAAIGAIVAKDGAACAVIALVSGGGPSPQRIVGWAGAIKADALTIPFREPPERHVKVTDYRKCSAIDEELAAHEDDVAAAIRAAVPR